METQAQIILAINMGSQNGKIQERNLVSTSTFIVFGDGGRGLMRE